VASAVPVLAGALLYSDTRFLGLLYDEGIAGASDGITVHPYDNERLAESTGKDGYSLARGLPALRRLMEERGDADASVWVTEVGRPTCPPEVHHWCVDEAEQARRVDEAVMLLRGWSWVGAVTVYELRDRSSELRSFEDRMGLLRRDLSPKPAFAAWREALARPLPAPPVDEPPAEEEDEVPPPGATAGGDVAPTDPAPDPVAVVPVPAPIPPPVETLGRPVAPAPLPRLLAVRRSPTDRSARVRLACPAPRACRGRVSVRLRGGRRLGAATVTLPARTASAWRRIALTRSVGRRARLVAGITRP
jgi:hypothetical protein